MAQNVKKTSEGAKASNQSKQARLIFPIAIAVALFGAAIAIFVSNNDTATATGDYSDVPLLSQAEADAAGINLFVSDDVSFPEEASDAATDIRQWRTNDGGFVIGNPNAPVTFVEFADFLCPACQDYKSEVDRMLEELVMTGQMKFEFRFFPTAGGETGEFLMRIAECADILEPGSFWTAHDEIFAYANNRGLNIEGRDVADRLGLNYAEVLGCVEDADQVSTDVGVGRSAGVSGTPGTRVRYADGPLQTLPGYDRGGIPFGVIAATIGVQS